MKTILKDLAYISLLFGLWADLGSVASYAQPVITTAAGTGATGFSGDGGPATSAKLGAGTGTGATLNVAVDNAGNLLIVDGGNRRIRRVNGSGIVTTIAGGGGATSGGGQATATSIFPGSVSTDAAGNMYIAQGASIWKVNTSGIITTIAGGPFPGFSGDGGPATAATFFCTNAVADAAGNVYIADSTNQRIRKIDTSGIINTVAGTGTQGYSGDGGPATSAKLALPQGLAVDSAGNLYFADNATRVRKVDTNGIITTVAGNGSTFGGDGGSATSAGMIPTWVTVDNAGNLYIVDSGLKKIRKVNTSGIISSVAGGALNTGLGNGDGGPPTGGVFVSMSSVAVDPAGNIYISDPGADNVRKVSSGAAASPVTATPSTLSFSVNAGAAAPPTQTVTIGNLGATLTYTASASTTGGGPWLSVTPVSGNVNSILTIAVNPSGVAAGSYNGTVTVTPSGAGNTPLTIPVKLTVNAAASQAIISTIAGNGLTPFSGEGGAATAASLGVGAVAVDGSGNVYISDTVSNKILKVSSSGTITTFAGNGSITFAGDNGPATKASFFTPLGVAADNNGNVYIADSLNNRVRKVDAAGTITTVAGNGTPAFSGDGGPAASAGVWGPSAVAVDTAGNLYIADSGDFRVRKVDTSGIIRTFAGGAILAGFSGDGGPAVGAGLFLPGGLAVDKSGNVFIADIGNNRIRKVNASGVISTVAGNGTKGFSGDGGQATSAMLNMFGAHAGLGVDAAGNLYIPDIANHRVRKVDSSGVIATVAGNGIAGFSGDGGPATSAGLNNPNDVAVDSSGNLYISDSTNSRVRKVITGAGGAPPAISANGVVNGASFQPGVIPNSWVTIQGANLAGVTDTWANAIVGGKLPTSLDGVTVSVGGKPAYLYYVSPTQINLLAPDIPAGSTQVTVTTSAGASSTFTVSAAQYGPAFFAWPNNQAVATRQDFSFAVAPGTFAGATTTSAKPGDVIILWGTGFGPTTPAAPTGIQVPGDQTYSTSTLPVVTINGVAATVYGAALAPGFAGLYQIAIQVPPSLGNGAWPVVATIGGVSSPSGISLAVQK